MEFFQFILKAAKEYGFAFFIKLILLMSCGAILYLSYLYCKNKINKQDKPSDVRIMVNTHEHHDEHSTTRELSNHSFFRIIDKMISYDINHLEIKERLRRALFRDFLLIVFTIYRDKIDAFVKNGDMDQLDSSLFHRKLTKLNTDMLNTYEEIAREKGIPEVVITKFNYWHKDRSKVIENFINDICDSNEWYTQNAVKFYSYLNQMVSILDLTLVDARKTLINLNGELDAVTYKGLTAEPKSKHKSEGN